MKSKFTLEEKQNIIMEKFSVKELCNKYNLSKSTIYEWKKLYANKQSSTGRKTSFQELQVLEFKIEKLQKEKQIYCLSGCTPKSSLDDIINAIIELNDKYSIHTLCDAFGILRSTYYHRLRIIKKPTSKSLMKEKIKVELLNILETSKYRMGARKIKIKLDEKGYQVSPRQITKLMREMNVSRRIINKRSKKKRTHKIDNNYYKNLLDQNFNQSDPNIVWVSDVTQVKNENKKVFYICSVIDLFSRMIISTQVSERNNSQLVSECLLTAYNVRNKPQNLIFHSDQGRQYTSGMFQKLLESLNIEQSLSRRGCPYDNAVIESFFHT